MGIVFFVWEAVGVGEEVGEGKCGLSQFMSERRLAFSVATSGFIREVDFGGCHLRARSGTFL
jgi:hypothetical protein